MVALVQPVAAGSCSKGGLPATHQPAALPPHLHQRPARLAGAGHTQEGRAPGGVAVGAVLVCAHSRRAAVHRGCTAGGRAGKVGKPALGTGCTRSAAHPHSSRQQPLACGAGGGLHNRQAAAGAQRGRLAFAHANSVEARADGAAHGGQILARQQGCGDSLQGGRQRKTLVGLAALAAQQGRCFLAQLKQPLDSHQHSSHLRRGGTPLRPWPHTAWPARPPGRSRRKTAGSGRCTVVLRQRRAPGGRVHGPTHPRLRGQCRGPWAALSQCRRPPPPAHEWCRRGCLWGRRSM